MTRKKAPLRMVVTVPRIEGLTAAEQRAGVRDAIKSTGDYCESRVNVRSLTAVEEKALRFIRDNRPANATSLEATP